MKKYFYLVLILFICGCKKSYTYVEIIDERSIFGNIEEKEEEPEKIKAKNDSLAYIEAYKKFNISLKNAKDAKAASGNIYKYPKDFKILNSDGKSVKYSISNKNREKIETELDLIIDNLPNLYE